MSKKITYEDEPIKLGKKVQDFLPPPSQLVLKDDQRITINLSKHSVDFFKKIAKKHDTSYQRMIRSVLDKYTEFYLKK